MQKIRNIITICVSLLIPASCTTINSITYAAENPKKDQPEFIPKSTDIFDAFKYSPDEVAHWLDAGTHIDAWKKDDRDFQRPTHFAAKHPNPEFLQLLVARKADVNHNDQQGRTPLLLAVKTNKARHVAILLQARADCEAHSFSRRALHESFIDKTGIITKSLLDAKADFNALDSNGSTPLIWASAHRNHKAVALLLQARSDTSVRDQLGRTALSAARGDNEIEELLKDAARAVASSSSRAVTSVASPACVSTEQSKAVTAAVVPPTAHTVATTVTPTITPAAPAHAGSSWRCALPCCCCRNCAKKDKDA